MVDVLHLRHSEQSLCFMVLLKWPIGGLQHFDPIREILAFKTVDATHPNMEITHASAGASKLWAGTVVVEPNVKTGAHHHGELETVLYIVTGRARFRWGDRLEFVAEAGPGDFIYVPPFVPHQEMNARADEPVEAVVVRSGQEPVVVNLDIESPEVGSSPSYPFHPASNV